MIRPEVRPDNHQEVYDFYTDYYNPRLAKFGGYLMRAAYHPRAVWAPGAEQEVEDHLSAGNALALIFSHSSHHDQFPVAAFAYREKPLSPAKGNAFIWAKAELFSGSRLLRWAIDSVGAVPTFRRNYFSHENEEINERLQLMRREAQANLFSCTADRISRGQIFTGFGEGTRNKGDTSKIQNVERGPGIIESQVDPELKLAFLAVAIHYPRVRGTKLRNRIRPTMYANNLLQGPFDGIDDISEKLQASLQTAMDAAIDLHR